MPRLTTLLRRLLLPVLASFACSATLQAQPARPAAEAGAGGMVVALQPDGHGALLDGAQLAPIASIDARPEVLGRPLVSPDGRRAYVGSRTGWITQLDLPSGRVVAEVQVARDLRALALGGDGRWLLAAGDEPPTLALFDADLARVKTFALTSLDGKAASRVAGLRYAPRRGSFIVALADLPEVWEISLDPQAAPIYDGLVHDYRMGEGIARSGFLGVRRTPLAEPLHGFVLDPDERHLIGARAPRGDEPVVLAVNLDARVAVAGLAASGRPRLDEAATFTCQGRPFLASANDGAPVVDVFDLKAWKRAHSIALPAPAAFLGSHEASKTFWIGTEGAGLRLVDKCTLEPVAEVRPPDGATVAQAFSPEGRRLLIGTRGPDALLVYDLERPGQTARQVLPAPPGTRDGDPDGDEAATPAPPQSP